MSELLGLTVGRVRAALEGVPDDVPFLFWEEALKRFVSSVEINLDKDGNIVEVVVG